MLGAWNIIRTGDTVRVYKMYTSGANLELFLSGFGDWEHNVMEFIRWHDHMNGDFSGVDPEFEPDYCIDSRVYAADARGSSLPDYLL